MNCLNVKEKIVEYLEDLLPEAKKREMAAHFEICGECRRALSSASGIQARLTRAGGDNRPADFEHRVIDGIIREQNRRLKQAGALTSRLEKWRHIMKTRTAKFSAAAVAAFALIFGIGILTNIPNNATAGTFLSQAMEALSGLSSIHMEARMRSRIGDNFGSICLECDFIPVEMWKQIDDGGTLRWRLEKPVRTIVMDGDATTMIVGEEWASRHPDAEPPGKSFDAWMGQLLDVYGLLDSELIRATEDGVRNLVLIREKLNGRDKILLEVDITTDVPENDYCRDAFLDNADHLKVYQFDAETKVLESFQLFVITGGEEVLVFEITDIEYDAVMDDTVMILELPDGIIMWQSPEVLPDNEKYQTMTPLEATQVIFESCANGDWEEFAKFLPASGIRQATKDALGGVELVSLGEPFQSTSYTGWFVPYEIELNDGSIHEGNLALRNDNKAERFVIDGGL